MTAYQVNQAGYTTAAQISDELQDTVGPILPVDPTYLIYPMLETPDASGIVTSDRDSIRGRKGDTGVVAQHAVSKGLLPIGLPNG